MQYFVSVKVKKSSVQENIPSLTPQRVQVTKSKAGNGPKEIKEVAPKL